MLLRSCFLAGEAANLTGEGRQGSSDGEEAGWDQ